MSGEKSGFASLCPAVAAPVEGGVELQLLGGKSGLRVAEPTTKAG